MSYSMDEFFTDHVLPGLKKAIEPKVSDTPPGEIKEWGFQSETWEKVLNVFRQAVNNPRKGEEFAREVLKAVICMDIPDVSPEKFMSACFTTRYDDKQLMSIEYRTDDGTKVKIDYSGKESEDLDSVIQKIS